MQSVKKKIFDIIQIGNKSNGPSRSFDYAIVFVIVVNLCVTLFATFEESKPYIGLIDAIELICVLIFTVEYLLRIWTAEFLFPDRSRGAAVIKYIFSFYGLVDLLTFFPFYLPFVFPAGAVAFRMFRVIRIFRLFQINAQYDAFHVIIDVLNEKKNQIFSSVSIVAILMLASSLCMYGLEHEAQPEQFRNAFSGIWWSVSTLLTVGYGDIYPITTLGKVMAIFISFLGVGVVAIPTGIISAGFVEQYTKVRRNELYAEEKTLKFVTSVITDQHPWHDAQVKEVVFPPQLVLVVILRNDEELIPRGDTVLRTGDTLVFGAKHFRHQKEIDLKEIVIKEEHPWVGMEIKDLDISRQELVVMIQRKDRIIVPNGTTSIRKGDTVVLYTKHRSGQ